MMNYTRTKAWFFLSIALALVPGVSPGQEKRMTVDELTKRADAVVVGKVTGLESEWSSDRSRIYTRVTLGVDRYLKGQGEGASITILTPGGEIGDVGEVYSHMPTFHKDENVVVFVEKDSEGRYRVAGGIQGKLMILQAIR